LLEEKNSGLKDRAHKGQILQTVVNGKSDKIIEEETSGMGANEFVLPDLMSESRIEEMDIKGSYMFDLKISLAFIHERESQIQKIIKDMKFPILKEDEYKAFHTIFDRFKQSYNNFLMLLGEQLDPSRMKKLQDILSTKTYIATENQELKQRKILKVKSHN